MRDTKEGIYTHHTDPAYRMQKKCSLTTRWMPKKEKTKPNLPQTQKFLFPCHAFPSFLSLLKTLKKTAPSRSLLNLTRRRWMRSRRFCIGSMISRHILSQARQRDRAGGEMDDEQPKAQAIDGVVHLVRVRHPVSRCEDGETKH